MRWLYKIIYKTEMKFWAVLGSRGCRKQQLPTAPRVQETFCISNSSPTKVLSLTTNKKCQLIGINEAQLNHILSTFSKGQYPKLKSIFTLVPSSKKCASFIFPLTRCLKTSSHTKNNYVTGKMTNG